MAVLLWLLWLYLGGRGWPARTAAARRHYLRANSLTGSVWAWSLLAGALSIVALTGLWIVLFQLVPMSGNRLPDYSQFPLFTVGLVLAMASIVNAVAEEAGLRGYLQGMLEADVGGPAAVLITALVIAPGHGLTQGFALPTFVFYLFADVMFGTLAYLTQSIRPGIVVHAAGIFVFFVFIWPHDATRGDAWLYIHIAQVLAFGAAAILVFHRLSRVVASARP
jgi:membrane protease YdiL (CAAX protease family)